MKLLKDKTAIVTGGAGGIGAACARRFAEEGASFILIADLNLEEGQARADEITKEFGTHCIAAVSYTHLISNTAPASVPPPCGLFPSISASHFSIRTPPRITSFLIPVPEAFRLTIFPFSRISNVL